MRKSKRREFARNWLKKLEKQNTHAYTHTQKYTHTYMRTYEACVRVYVLVNKTPRHTIPLYTMSVCAHFCVLLIVNFVRYFSVESMRAKNRGIA